MFSPMIEIHAKERREAAMRRASQERRRRADRRARGAVRVRLAHRLLATAGRLDPELTAPVLLPVRDQQPSAGRRAA